MVQRTVARQVALVECVGKHSVSWGSAATKGSIGLERSGSPWLPGSQMAPAWARVRDSAGQRVGWFWAKVGSFCKDRDELIC